MSDVLHMVYDEIASVKSLEQFRLKISECVEILDKEGLIDIAYEIKELSAIQINRFSRQATQESVEYSKERILDYLKRTERTEQGFSETEAVKIVLMMLEHFHDYCRCLYKEKIHGKCSDSFQKNLPCLKIENEYDVQRLMYPVIRTVFPNARIEVTEDSGHHTVRKDIVIDSCNIVIELKCTSETVTERRISDEIAADMVHYGNRYIFFYIYDKGNVIKNALDFRNTYEGTSIEDKKAFVRIWQSNDI